MAHVVGMLLLHCGPPYQSFRMFGNIVMSETLSNFYSINKFFIRAYYKVFWRLLKEMCPIIYTALTKGDELVSCSVFLFGWVLTLFS